MNDGTRRESDAWDSWGRARDVDREDVREGCVVVLRSRRERGVRASIRVDSRRFDSIRFDSIRFIHSFDDGGLDWIGLDSMTPDDGLTMFWWTFACACAMASDMTVVGRATPRRARRAFRALLARGKIEDGGGGDGRDGDDEDGPCMRAFSRARVPHRWFQHFYVVGCAANAATLARRASTGGAAASAATVAVLVLFQAHLCRRLYESVWVSSYRRGATMHAGAYALGLVYYLCASRTWAGDASPAEAEASLSVDAARDLTSVRAIARVACVVVGALAFAVGNYRQHECHAILAAARRAKSSRAAPSKKSYVIPRGGWFERFSCAHYTAEIVIYLGLLLIRVSDDVFTAKWRLDALFSPSSASRRRAPVALVVAVVSNLALAAREHHAWYVLNFKDEYPRHRTPLFPRVFSLSRA